MANHSIIIEERTEVEKIDLGFGHPLYKDPGWLVSCACGEWKGNDPLESEADAYDAYAYHLRTAEIEENRATAVEAFHNAESDMARNKALDAYIVAGSTSDTHETL